MTKKFFAILMALVLTLSLSAVAFASGDVEDQPTTSPTYNDMSTVTLTKTYNLTNEGTKSPKETFTFSALTCTGVANAGVGVTAANAPVPTIGSVSYAAGEAGSDTKTKAITINLPPYTAVGVYTYTFTENEGGTAGVTYRSEPITLVVTVIEQNGKVRVAAVHTEDASSSTKTDTFTNTYSAGSLSVTKNVTGNMGDKDKYFTIHVTFKAPEGKSVNEDITYKDGGLTVYIENAKRKPEAWQGGEHTSNIRLKDGETVTFNNIPYGVTYTVVEEDYTADGYTVSYDNNQTGTINSASTATTVTNNKGGTVDTGITMDSMPYIVLLALAVVGLAAVTMKKRYEA